LIIENSSGSNHGESHLIIKGQLMIRENFKIKK